MKYIIYLMLLFSMILHAKPVDISKEGVSLIASSEVYFDEQNLSFSEIKKVEFKAYPHSNINIGIERKSIWLKMTFENKSSETVEKILLFGSPFLENILLYVSENQSPEIKGMAHDNSHHKTLQYYHTIELEAQTQKTYYVKIYSDYSPVSFTLSLEDKGTYIEADHYEQLIDIALLGFIVALMIYGLLIGVYAKEISYVHYGLYLLALLYFQLTYLGFTQTYASYAFVEFTLAMAVIGPLFLVVTTALFAISFLKINRYPKLHKGYVTFIVLALLSMVPFYKGGDMGMSVMMGLSFLLIIYTLSVAIYVYRKGYKQAKLYIVGVGIVFVSYVMIIGDALGLISVMQHLPNILLWATALEALILSLAFADRYMILQKEKALLNARYLEEANQRESLVQTEVDNKTEALNEALEEKELLLQEVHHRVKNNLQIILSIIQLKGDDLEEEEKNILIDLENRINAIAKTYETLIVNDDLQHIDMQFYVQQLLNDMQETFDYLNNNIEIDIYSNAKLPLKEAVYVGLIINELVTNAYKYAFIEKKGNILVSFMEEKEARYVLRIEDDGKGFTRDPNADSLGLKLMETLVLEQLKGSIAMDGKEGTKYLIAFGL